MLLAVCWPCCAALLAGPVLTTWQPLADHVATRAAACTQAYAGNAPLLSHLHRLGVWKEGDLHPCSLGRTPLHYAAMSGQAKACETLLKWGFGTLHCKVD